MPNLPPQYKLTTPPPTTSSIITLHRGASKQWTCDSGGYVTAKLNPSSDFTGGPAASTWGTISQNTSQDCTTPTCVRSSSPPGGTSRNCAAEGHVQRELYSSRRQLLTAIMPRGCARFWDSRLPRMDLGSTWNPDLLLALRLPARRDSQRLSSPRLPLDSRSSHGPRATRAHNLVYDLCIMTNVCALSLAIVDQTLT